MVTPPSPSEENSLVSLDNAARSKPSLITITWGDISSSPAYRLRLITSSPINSSTTCALVTTMYRSTPTEDSLIGRQCGSRRAQSHRGRRSSVVSTSTRRRSGSCQTAAWHTNARASASVCCSSPKSSTRLNVRMPTLKGILRNDWCASMKRCAADADTGSSCAKGGNSGDSSFKSSGTS